MVVKVGDICVHFGLGKVGRKRWPSQLMLFGRAIFVGEKNQCIP